MSAEQSLPKVRLPYLDGLRGLAALWVLASHAFDMLGWSAASHAPFVLWALVGATSYARMAVAAFIVISGFSLMLPLAKQAPHLTWKTLISFAGDFYRRRARRILPPYYAALLFSLGLALLLRHVESFHRLVPDLVGHVLLLHDISFAFYHWDQYAAFNAPLWSVAVEWHIYALFPLLVMLWQRYGILRTAALSTGAVCIVLEVMALRATRSLDFPFYWGGMTFPYYAFFVFGAMAAVVAYGPSEEARRLRRTPFGWLTAICFSGSLAAVAYWPKGVYMADSEAFACPFAVATVFLLIFLTTEGRSRLNSLLSNRFLVFVGGFSYSVYLIHFPLFLLMGRVMGHFHLLASPLGFWLILLVFCPLTLFIAYVFSSVMERQLGRTSKSRKLPVVPPLSLPEYRR